MAEDLVALEVANLLDAKLYANNYMLKKLNIMRIFRKSADLPLKSNTNKISCELIGLLVAMIGFFIAITGGVIGFSGFPSAGYWIAVVGVLTGIVGIILHFIINATQIFR